MSTTKNKQASIKKEVHKKNNRIVSKKKNKTSSRKTNRDNKSNKSDKSNKTNKTNSRKSVRKDSNYSIKLKKLLHLYYKKKELCDHIWIDGTISFGEMNDDDEIKYQDIFNQLIEFSKNNKLAVIVHIDSHGGSLQSGIMLYNLFKKFDKPLIGVVEYACASAATFPFMACDLRIVKPYSWFLIHQTSLYLGQSKFKEIRRIVYSLENTHKMMKKFWTTHAKISDTEIHQLLRSDTVLSPEYCIKYQIAHEIFEPNMVKKLKVSEIPDIDQTREVLLSTFIKDLPYLIRPELIQAAGLQKIVVYVDPIYRGYLYGLTVINLMLEIPIPITFIASSAIKTGNYMMSLFADESYLLNVLSYVELENSSYFKSGINTNDIIEDKFQSVIYFRKIIMNILKKKTKVPDKILQDIFTKGYIFTSEEAEKYHMFYKVIDPESKIFKINDDLDPPIKPTQIIM